MHPWEHHGGEDTELGVFVRYRRWLGRDQSLDVAFGTPVMGNSYTRTSPYGLVKWNLNRWIGVAVGEKPGFALSALGAAIIGIRTLLAFARGS